MNPIAVILTDTHLDQSNIEVNKSIYQQAIDFLIDNGLSTLIHMGDIFDSRKSQSQKVLIAFDQILQNLQSNGIRMIAIPGNHDKTDYDSAESFLSPFSGKSNFVLIKRGKIVNKSFISNNNEDLQMWIGFLPYFSNDIYLSELENIKKEMHENEIEKLDILITHIDIDGAVMNNGQKIESSIKTKHFNFVNNVYIGHYHDKMSWSNIHFLGASMQHNFGESSEKGMYILYDNGSVEFISLDFPKYIKYEVDIKSLSSKDIKDLEEEKNNGKDYIRVVLVGEEQDVKSFNIQRLKQIGVDVKLKVPEIEEKELQKIVKPFTLQTLNQQFAKFCKEKKIDHKKGMQYFNKLN